ncbi:MAG: Fur family transcriptional regulator [Candidatus Gastranaerophilaceae bacterium]
MSYSVQKEIVLKTLKENVVHPTAEYLCTKIKEEFPNVGTATVYRNLKKMSENGLIKRIDGLEPATHYDHNTHEHFHFMCDKCKRIYDVPSSIAPNIPQKATEATGFVITDYDVILHGICEHCK